MAALDPVLFRELPVIQKIIADETWFEGERRGCAVTPDDPAVRAHVCEIILRIGAEMRARLEAEVAGHPAPVMLPSGGGHGHAA